MAKLEPLEQRQLAHRLAARAGRARRLRVLAFASDRRPRPAAALLTGRPAPHPAAALLHPPFADQRLAEAVAVLREVVAKPPLHAGRALVRGDAPAQGR